MSGAGKSGGGVFAGVGGMAAAVAAAVALVLRLAPLDDPARPESRPDVEGLAPTVTTGSDRPSGVAELADAGALFDEAARALRDAGTFAYAGTVVAPGASVTWPTGLAGAEVEVDGRVALPIRVVERATTAGLVADTIISGRGVWQRSASTAADVGAVPWGLVAQSNLPGLGLTQLPQLLESATDGRVSGITEAGGWDLTGVVEQLDVGGPSSTVTARLDVDVDKEGVPRRVVVTAPAAPDGADQAAPAFRLDVAILDLGLHIDIGPPGERELGVTPSVSAADVSAAGLASPVQFTRLPEGLVLAHVDLEVRDWDPGCPTLWLFYYHAVTDVEERLSFNVRNEACASRYGPSILDPVPLGGAWWGTARRDGPTGARVEASNGTTHVYAVSRRMDVEELVELVATLGPYDPGSQPYLVAPLGTPVLGGDPPA